MVRERQRKIVLEDQGGRKAANVFLQPPLCRAEQNSHHSSTTHYARLKKMLSKQDTYLGDLTASLNNMHQLLQNWTAGIKTFSIRLDCPYSNFYYT